MDRVFSLPPMLSQGATLAQTEHTNAILKEGIKKGDSTG